MVFLKMRIKGMLDPVVWVSVTFIMMVMTLLLTYQVLNGNVPDIERAIKALRIIIIQNLVLDSVVGIRLCIPIIKEIHQNGFISLFKLSDEELDDQLLEDELEEKE